MKLAINGGTPVRTKPFPANRVIGQEEKEAVMKVIDSGVLSKFLGSWDREGFYGGDQVQALEKEWAEHFGVKHAIAVNSCTSGLYCAMGATGIEPGEEVIVTPYTMSASVTSAIVFNAVPVFADIDEDTFCLNPAEVEKKITPRTKAIVVVDLFGHPYDADTLNAIAKKHGIYVIEDTAQAPNASYKGRKAGTLGDIGVYSLNYHKHIHCGEGGIIVTNDDALAEKMQLIRNHAEAVVEAKGVKNIVNMIGFNFRLPEMECAITRCQLKKLPQLVKDRQENCEYLSEKFKQLPMFKAPAVKPDCTHSYYVYSMRYDETQTGVPRNKIVEALQKELPVTEMREYEGPMIWGGYVKPLYLQPMFQQKIAYGSKGFPFYSPLYEGTVDYSKGLCPVTERMYEKELIMHEIIHAFMNKDDMNDLYNAFEKVIEHIDELK
jgi:dTDP-4-amino-4,6-dideoxygalactose transaminase